MNLTRCTQGHFFDQDKYSSCPHCQSAKIDNQTKPIVESTNIGSNPVPTERMPQRAGDGRATIPITPPQPNNSATMPLNLPITPPQPAPRTIPDDTGKTIGMFPTSKSGKMPVVGWLVCTEGPHFGEDFRLVSGKNFIGRNASMDVALTKDSSVSRERHASIIFEPNEAIFIMQSGESKQLAYLNGNVVLTPKQLSPYDKIKLGASILTFVPLCTESFKWNF